MRGWLPGWAGDEPARRAAVGSILLVLAVTAGCSEEVEFPSEPPTQVKHELTPPQLESPSRREARMWLTSPLPPCRSIVEDMRRTAGAGARSCNDTPSTALAIQCANASIRRGLPFTMCDGRWGFDSWHELGVAGQPNGNVVFYALDTFGPRYKGTCLRRNVALSDEGWPQCALELAGKTALDTGEPWEDPSTRYDNWPETCREQVLRVKRVSFPPKIVSRRPLVTHPARWDVDCSRFALHFELLIDETGHVACVSVPEKLSPPGLADEVRRNLSVWRFEPPNIYERSVSLRWGMQAWRCDPFSYR